MLARDLGAELAALDHQHALRHGADEVEVLLHQHDGQAEPIAQQGERLRDLFDDRGLDAFGRLVEQQDRSEERRVGKECCG